METGSLSESFKKTENIAATFFGEDATVEKIYEGDKLKHIVFTWEYQTSCSATETLPLPAAMPESVKFSKKEDAQTIVVKSWTNPVTYEVFRQDEYLKKTDKNNLLLTTETETETKKTTFDQVKNVFQFEYNVEVRTIKIEVPPDPFVDKNAYLAQVEKYLKEKALFVLRPASTTAKLDYEYVPFESHSFNYLFDRNFYPEGERGDKAFEQAKKLSDQIDYQTPLLELTFSLTNEKATSLSIAIFDETEAESKILKQYLFMPENIKASNTLVTVDNQSINATKYLVPLKEVAVGSKESATKTEVTPEVKSSLQVVVIFNFAGKKYLINFFGVAKEAEASNLLKFTSFNTNNTQELAQIISEIREAVTQRTQLPGEAIPGEPTQIRK